MRNGLSDFKDVGILAAKRAGKILKDNFGKVKKVSLKGNQQLVSNVDLEAEKAIIETISRSFPDHSIMSEENSRLKKSEFRWIIDPLDGTHNFIKGIPIFGTSIALEYRKEVVLGILLFPLSKRLYWAAKGNGTYLNDKKIRVSSRPLAEATCVYDSSIRLNVCNMLPVLGNLAREVFNLRMFGSSAEHLALVAEGKIDLDIEFNDKAWDFAAGALLVKEAGGEFTDFKGKVWSADMPNYVASNGIMHQEVLGIIKNSLPGA